MPADALKSLVQALLDHLPKESSPIVVKPDRPASAPIRTNGHQSKARGMSYDPSVVYLLESATVIALRDSDTIAAVGEWVADALQNVVRDASNSHPLIVSRAVFYLLHLLNASQVGNDHSASEIWNTNFIVGSFVRPRSSHPSYNFELRSAHPRKVCNLHSQGIGTLH